MEAERFDPNSVGLYVQRFDGKEDRLSPTAPPGDRFLTFPLDNSELCGSTRFRLGQGAGGDVVYSNSVSNEIQPELFDLTTGEPPEVWEPGMLLEHMVVRGVGPWTVAEAGGPCYARAVFDGKESRESELSIISASIQHPQSTLANARIPSLTSREIQGPVRTEGISSQEALPIDIGPFTPTATPTQAPPHQPNRRRRLLPRRLCRSRRLLSHQPYR